MSRLLASYYHIVTPGYRNYCDFVMLGSTIDRIRRSFLDRRFPDYPKWADLSTRLYAFA